MMEDVSGIQNHIIGPLTEGMANYSKPSQDDPRLHYSIPGILHFIQHEWARFEMERAQWEVEKAELQARVAFLQGERKGQENLKDGLIKRIKMLEYALKQERVKFHKLKYGTDLNFGDLKVLDDISEPVEDAVVNGIVSWRQGRQLLKQYLQEIGYTDTVIAVRSTRVRNLLNLASSDDKNQDVTSLIGEQGRDVVSAEVRVENISTEKALMEAEQSVLDTFSFLSSDNFELDNDKNVSDEMGNFGTVGNEDLARSANVEEETYSEDALASFKFLGNGDDQDRNADLDVQGGTPQRPLLGYPDNEDGTFRGVSGLGELASLTVNNEAEEDSANEGFRKIWNAKYTLRSHFDGVRAVAFHPVEPVLITASEDHTLKLWNLQEAVSAGTSASLDVEPVYTFRAHTGPVLCLAMSTSGDQCFSGGMDNTMRCWNVPSSVSELYGTYDPNVLTNTLEGHTDAVWGLSVHSTKLLSCSADGTVCLWSPQCKVPLLQTYSSTIESDGIPTSVDFLRSDTTQMVTAYSSSSSVIFDLETGKPVVRLDSNQTPDAHPLGKQINRIVSHPTLPLTVTAHEDRHIRIFDNNTGQMIHSMVAHLDAVTSLAIDPNGIYLLSGSHDCSVRLWNMDSKTCVQEITAHRKKFDEAIFDVAFHPSKPYFASAGADAVAKVFV